jgi:hypothetical protein
LRDVAAVSGPAKALALQRLAGNRAPGRALARETIDLEPRTGTGSLGDIESSVSGLDHLRGQGVDPAGMSVSRDAETIRRNSPPPNRALPWETGNAWDAAAILRALGQYDTMSWTDSDAIRCVQAVALASRIADGPQAVESFLGAMIADGMMMRQTGQRQRTAIAVLEFVRGRIATRRAVFGDLIGAQEALHDLFYNDVLGTPSSEILNRVAPTLDLGRQGESADIWCASPEEVIRQANGLKAGEQFLLNTWTVVFNRAFDDLSDMGIEVAEGRSTLINTGGRNVRIRRINTDAKPPHTAIDLNRDSQSGHQLLIIKDAVSGRPQLYEPEVTASGRHLEELTVEVLERYFADQAEVGIFSYIQILGKLTRSSLGSGAWD